MDVDILSYKDLPGEVVTKGQGMGLLFPDKPQAKYFAGYEGDVLVCLTCLVVNKDKTASIKSNFTVEEYRGKGYFTALNKCCLDYARKQGVSRILLNCFKDSVGIHTKQGARVWKTTKNITWMIYDKGF